MTWSSEKTQPSSILLVTNTKTYERRNFVYLKAIMISEPFRGTRFPHGSRM
jgi:hypothetical protein